MPPTLGGSLSMGYQPNAPFCLSAYVLNACKHGTLFSWNTYRVDNVNYWATRWLSGITEGIIFPNHLAKAKVQLIFSNKVLSGLKKDALEMFESIDVNDVESLRDFVETNREKGRENLERLERFLRQDEFPPFLWMEYSRFHQVFIETSDFIENAINRAFKFKPRRRSQIHERNKLTRARFLTYSEFVDNYFEAVSSFYRLGIFLEVWSCENESDLFTEKNVWTFRNVNEDLFEPLFLGFHNSITRLRQSFFRFSPQETRIDLSRPTDWAFKQLVLMT